MMMEWEYNDQAFKSKVQDKINWVIGCLKVVNPISFHVWCMAMNYKYHIEKGPHDDLFDIVYKNYRRGKNFKINSYKWNTLYETPRIYI